MGDIAGKLTYLAETKTLIKQAITNKGVTVSDSDTFRSYASKIDNITVGGSDMIQDVYVEEDLTGDLVDLTSDEGFELTDQNRYYEVDRFYKPSEFCFKIQKSVDINQSLIVDCMFTDNDTNTNSGAIFAYDYLCYNMSGDTNSFLNGTGIDYNSDPKIIQPNIKYSVKYNTDNLHNFYIDDTKIADFSTVTPSFTGTMPMALGGELSNDTVTNWGSKQGYYIYKVTQVIDGNTHIYKPVYDMLTAQYGLLDSFDNTFYAGYNGYDGKITSKDA